MLQSHKTITHSHWHDILRDSNIAIIIRNWRHSTWRNLFAYSRSIDAAHAVPNDKISYARLDTANAYVNITGLNWLIVNDK